MVYTPFEKSKVWTFALGKKEARPGYYENMLFAMYIAFFAYGTEAPESGEPWSYRRNPAPPIIGDFAAVSSEIDSEDPLIKMLPIIPAEGILDLKILADSNAQHMPQDVEIHT